MTRKLKNVWNTIGRFFVFWGLVVAIVILLSLLFESKDNQRSNKSNIANKLEVAGVIRSVDSKGWFVIDDLAHAPINIKKVETAGNAIRVIFNFQAKRIHSFIVAPDETFAKKGYFVGSSVTRSGATIYISKIVDGKIVLVDASKIKSAFGNFWIYGLFSK